MRASRSGNAAGVGDGELKELFHLSRQMLCIAGTDGYFKHVNPAFGRVLGYSEAQLLSRPFFNLVHPDDRQATEAEVARLAEGEVAIHFENRYRCQDGSWRWLDWMAAPSQDGKLIYAAATDVTDQRHAAEELRQSEHRYLELLQAVTSYRYRVEVEEGRPVSSTHSEGCLATTGYSPQDYHDNPYLWLEMVHPEDRSAVQQQIDHLLTGRNAPPLEHRIFHRDGRTLWVRSTVVPHRDSAGRLQRYDGLVEDITQRKQAELRLRTVLEYAPDAMMLVARDGRILQVNLQAERLFGYDRKELLGEQVELLVPEEARPRHREHRERYAQQPCLRPMGAGLELAGRRKDGTAFPAEISLSPLETPEGLVLITEIRDLTERKRIEQAIREREAQLTAAREIQRHLLPEAVLRTDICEAAGATTAADFAGGDYFDYFRLPDGNLALVVADVSGHSVAAALLMASTRAYTRSLAQHHSDLAVIAALANEILLSETQDHLFVTWSLCRIQREPLSLEYVSAGHSTGYVLDRQGTVRHRLPSTSLPLGALEGVTFSASEPVQLERGDTVVLVTDGVQDARDESDGDGPFGEGRLLACLGRHHALSPRALVARVQDDIRAHTGSSPLADDATIVAARLRGASSASR